MKENNTRVFDILNPTDNNILKEKNILELINIRKELKNYYLEPRETLGLSKDVTFGTEIEFEDSKRSKIEEELKITFPTGKWKVVDDRSLNCGGEINSPVLRDTKENWIELSTVCNIVDKNAVVHQNTSAHVHIGMQILGNNPKYWRNFAKLWMTYEYIITRFLYGEYTSPRDRFVYYAEPISKDLIEDIEILDKYSESATAMNILRKLNKTDKKRRSVNFRHIGKTQLYNYDKEANKNTIEFRGGNGTFDIVIWQNNINLLVKLLEYCKREDFNDKLIDARLKEIRERNIPSNIIKYSQIHINDAFEFADLIFTNNLDKIYFLRQYFKDMTVGSTPLAKSEEFTTTAKSKTRKITG